MVPEVSLSLFCSRCSAQPRHKKPIKVQSIFASALCQVFSRVQAHKGCGGEKLGETPTTRCEGLGVVDVEALISSFRLSRLFTAPCMSMKRDVEGFPLTSNSTRVKRLVCFTSEIPRRCSSPVVPVPRRHDGTIHVSNP